MRFSELRPILYVPDVPLAVEWYRRNLLFEPEQLVENGQWASIGRDGIGLLLAIPPDQVPYTGPHFTGSFYLHTDDVEAWWQRLQQQVPVVYPPETFPWGMREFAFRDLNGFVIQIGQEIP